jgi:membrane protease subunit HflC
MTTAFRSIGLALAALALFIGFRLCTYTVAESEVVVLTQFGKPVGQPVTRPGLHFRVPFVQTVNPIDKRILEWDGRANEMPTRDKLYVIVDTFGRWRISDPLTFFVTMRDKRSALSRLDDILGSEVRNAVAKHDLIEIVRTDKNRKPVLDETIIEATGANPLPAIKYGRTAIEREVVEEAGPKLKDFGIELLDIRFMRINYNERVTAKIFERMISERQQIASRFRSEGEGEAAKIMGSKERELLEVDSESYKEVQKIRGESEAKASAIYTAAYNTDPAAAEFYQFLRTMETYPDVLDKGSTLILSTDSDLMRFLKHSTPAKAAPPAPVAPASTAPTVPPQL